MDARRRQLVEEIFLSAAACEDAAARQRIISDRAGGDAQVEAEVRSLLGGHDAAGGVLDRRTAALGISVADAPTSGPGDLATLLPPGARIGGYIIARVIGVGGMGVVYVAEQDRPRRTVALKLIRTGLVGVGAGLMRRFEAEADILARLHHPGIAQIFEAGTAPVELPEDSPESGAWKRPQPFLAMELIDGPPIHEFADARTLGARERLMLMVQVCDAVQHAHQRGVIHRDLKPSNILVDASGEQPRVKVLDFGVARVTDADLRLTTIRTGVGALIGTLPYMSPEQVAADPADIDTRSDVYALGVITYQLLTGRMPHDLSSRSIPEAARIIRDEHPSRLSSIDRTFRGDIETIVARTLDKDRNRRYQSAGELRDDISRFLRGEPIAARRDSLGYLLNRRLRRYRAVASVSAAAVVALGVLGAYAVFKALEARRTAAELAVRLSESLIERGRMMVGTDQLHLGEAAIWDQLIQHPDSTLARWALWDMYSKSPCISTLPDFEASPHAVAFSGDGATCAVANRLAGKVEIWDRDLRSPVHVLDAGTDRVLSVAFHPHRPIIAAGNSLGGVRVWRADSGELLAERVGHSGWVGCVAFDPAGGLLATGGHDGVIRLWDALTLEPVRELRGHQEHILRLAFHPDRPELASTSYDRTARLWDYQTGTEIRILEGATRSPSRSAFCIAFSPDGRLLAQAGLERSLRIFRTDDYSLQATVRLPEFVVASLAFGPDSNTLFISHEAVEIRAASDGQLLRTIVYPDATARNMAISPDGQRVITAANRGRVSMWETEPGRCETRLPGSAGNNFALRFSPDGRHLVTPASGGRLIVRTTGRWDESRELASPDRMTVRTLDVSQDGRFVAAGTMDGRVRLWDLESLQLKAERAGDQAHADVGVAGVGFQPGGGLLATVGADVTARLWTVPDLQPAGMLDLRDPVTKARRAVSGLAWAPDGRSLAVALGGADSVLIWEPASGLTRLTDEIHMAQLAIAYDPRSGDLVVGGDQRLAVLDPRGRLLRELAGHTQSLTGLAIHSPDLLCSSSRDRTVRVWSWPSGTPLLSRPVEAPPMAIAISPDGRYLCCGLQSGAGIRIWDLGYYQAHIAGNALWHLNRYQGKLDAAGKRRVLEALGVDPSPKP